jgi:hypothetical protein
MGKNERIELGEGGRGQKTTWRGGAVVVSGEVWVVLEVVVYM